MCWHGNQGNTGYGLQLQTVSDASLMCKLVIELAVTVFTCVQYCSVAFKNFVPESGLYL